MHRNITNYLRELLVLVLHCYKLVPTTNVQYHSRVTMLPTEHRYELTCELKPRVAIMKKNRIAHNGATGICARASG